MGSRFIHSRPHYAKSLSAVPYLRRGIADEVAAALSSRSIYPHISHVTSSHINIYQAM